MKALYSFRLGGKMVLETIKELVNYGATTHGDRIAYRYKVGKEIEDKSYNRKRGEYQVNGFRVQVYSSNEPQVAKNEALELSELLSSQLHIGVYVNSEPPFWKVRLGDFLTREEANEFKLQVIKLFPELQGSTYIVPDLVTVNN